MCQLSCRVTVMKDKDNRRSRGVAFVLYLDRDSAQRAVRALHKTKVRSYSVTVIIMI